MSAKIDDLATLTGADLVDLAEREGLTLTVGDPFYGPGALLVNGRVDQVELILDLCARADEIVDALEEAES
jgi:hypothetical protein